MKRKRISIKLKSLKSEAGADNLASAPQMQPYLNWIDATLTGSDTSTALEAIRALPLEQRYVWRVVSALKWAFADYDSVSVQADRQTLTDEDLVKVTELLMFRPVQLCLFLKVLVGKEHMQALMVSAIDHATHSE